jgi:hypothetical protein
MTAFFDKNCRRMNEAGPYSDAPRAGGALRATECNGLTMGVR